MIPSQVSYALLIPHLTGAAVQPDSNDSSDPNVSPFPAQHTHDQQHRVASPPPKSATCNQAGVVEVPQRSVDMDNKVTLSLVALNGHHNPAHRSLAMDVDRPVIQIGRASKSQHKNLQEGVSNAWFDSPVMSRYHAELVFNPENKVLAIRDVGSMHGTFLDGHLRLKNGVLTPLKSGDKLVFGTEVKRGKDIYPACVFSVDIEHQAVENATVGYAFPDSEDEDEYEFSDIERDSSPIGNSGESMSSVMLQSPKQAVSEPIDLTNDDVDKVTKDNILQPATGHFRVHVPSSNPSNPIIVDSSEDDASVSSYECQDEPSAFCSSLTKEVSGTRALPVRDLLNEQNIENEDVIQPASKSSTVPLSPICRMTSADSLGFSSFYDEDFHDECPSDVESCDDNAYDLDSDSEVRDDIGNASDLDVGDEISEAASNSDVASDNDSENENESDCGLSEAGRDGLRALIDGSLLDTDNKLSFDSMKDSSQATCDFYYSSITPADSVFQKGLLERAPSPSDAAMVKPAVAPAKGLPLSYSTEVTVQSLGEKTGKHDFFEARDQNKSIMTSGYASRPTLVPQNCVSPTASTRTELQSPRRIATPRVSSNGRLPSLPTPSGSQEDAFKTLEVFETLDCDTEMRETMIEYTAVPITSSLSYLDNHAQAPAMLDLPSGPELDLTSAVKFNESRAALAKANDYAYVANANKTATLFASKLGDLPESKKRKAADISSDKISSIATDGQQLQVSNIRMPELGVEQAKELTGNPALEPATESVAVTVESAAVPDFRPAKRLKRFAEALSLVAVGGVAIFSALVATAPDFMS